MNHCHLFCHSLDYYYSLSSNSHNVKLFIRIK
ncbi:hypothetical protein [Enterococcus phage vB_Efs26_KEN12]